MKISKTHLGKGISMKKTTPLLLALTAWTCLTPLSSVFSADQTSGGSGYYSASPAIQVKESDSGMARRVVLGIGKSLVVDLPRDAKEVFVANPAVANAVVRSTRKAFVIGVAAGQTSVFFMDGEGRQIAALEIDISRDLQPVQSALRSALPSSRIKVDNINNGVVITGSVASAVDAQKAVDIASRFVGSNENVVNSLTIRAKDQVMLKVTVAEVQRSAMKQLGVDMSGSWQISNQALGFATASPLTGAAVSTAQYAMQRPSSNYLGTLRVLERNALLRTLAEPTLTAVSGESANFVAGGEVPVPVGRDCPINTATGVASCTTRIEFKKFGVSLNFTPVVLDEGRISLKVGTEVSEVSNESALSVGTGDSAITIPGFRTRKADTTVELPSGGSMAIAGLIQEQTKNAVQGIPGAKDIPILGTLLRSKDYQKSETELVIMVTPYIAQSVAKNEIALPDDGFADPSDPSATFLGRLNRVYGVSGGYDPKSPYHGRFGFITD